MGFAHERTVLCVFKVRGELDGVARGRVEAGVSDILYGGVWEGAQVAEGGQS